MINVLHLGLSYRCNMHCKHCYVVKNKDVLKENDYYTIIDEIYKQGLMVLYYTFGEPLCSEYLNKISSYVKDKNIVQILMTNGSLINDETIAMLKKNKIDKVCVSLDHIDPKKHDSNRNYKNSHCKAISSLKKLVNSGLKTEISMTVNDSNIMCLNEIFLLAEELKIDFVSFLRERTNNGIINMELEQEYHDFFKTIILRKSRVTPLFHDVSLISILKSMKAQNEIDEITYEKYYEMNCCHSKNTISIEPNGDVKKCNLQSCVLGNMVNKPLVEIIEREFYKHDYTIHCPSLSK